MTYRCPLPGLTIAMLMTSTALAQETETQPIMLDPITLTASRTGATVENYPGSAQVIEGEDIAARLESGEPLDRILGQLVPGLAPANGTIGSASQTLRGRSVQVLIDGAPRTSELRGFGRELSMIDPASIERIEIVKGSTARFGNGATGGLINIITKTPEDGERTNLSFGLSSGMEGGSIGTDLSFSHERRLNDLGLRLELSRRSMDDLFDGDGKQIPSDPVVGQGNADNYDSYSGAVVLDWRSGSNEITARVGGYHFTQGIDQFTDYSTDPVSVGDEAYTGQDVKDIGRYFNVTWRNPDLTIGETELQLYGSNTDRRAAFVPAGIANPLYYPVSPVDPTQDPNAQSELSTRTIGARFTVNTSLDSWRDGAQLTWGLDASLDDVSQTDLSGRDLIAPMTQKSLAGFAQLDVPVGQVDLSAGLRAEKFWLQVDDFTRPDAVQLSPAGLYLLPAVNVIGGDFNYDAVIGNIGATWHATPVLDLFANISQGFSVPDVGSFTRRAMPANPFAPGQTVSFAALRPDAQIVNTAELGLRYSGDRLQASASAFLSTSDEGTVFESATNTVTQQKERVWGGEAQLSYQAGDALTLGALLGWQEGNYDADGDGSRESWLPNNRIPTPFTATLTADYLFRNNLRLQGELAYAAGRDKAGQPELDEMITVNLFGSYPLARGAINFGITNLFDRAQDNITASSVRENPLTADAIRVADQGRRIYLSYGLSF
ncbi:TonB-dependent receptor [Paracoccus fistulariae]|uniref:TonB-dependent receptor n=1 Tax=Paracoccus fistulariae TaxID=658446 RepID=A0ABY7SGD1_9RHOB|nr:TonB-dependent receptor [Paracoccus fistulariae]MDB6181773.1 TonB-dependent receptor [Paracoccus fistulariae]WCR05934.1 TonB-dependent receptor [Paracoccus fistulariae]